MKRFLLLSFLILAVPAATLAISQCGASPMKLSSLVSTTPTPDARLQDIPQAEAAIRNAIRNSQDGASILMLAETKLSNLRVSQTNEWAVAWMNPIDPATGHIIPAEPGLAIVQKTDAGWKATLPHDPSWAKLVAEAPEDILSAENKQEWLTMYASQDALASAASTATYSGYYLPWAGGKSMVVTQSVGHDKYDSTKYAHYAFDFATGGYPSGMFDVYAAKGGTVWMARDTCENGDEDCSNFLVLQDTNTSPTTYQLYLHLAEGTIPAALHTKGTWVSRGEFIGTADDTGKSSGNHLHFHVHTYASSYWGKSVDITFEDVAINGGRPRISSDLSYCLNTSAYQDICSQTKTTYVSGNVFHSDGTPPVGSISAPQMGAVVSTGVIRLQGVASDEGSGLGKVQFIGRYNGTWYELGQSSNSSPISYDWDLCDSGVPDGPVDVALKINDNDGNSAVGLPGLTHFIKQYSCPTTTATCSPAANQIALYADPGYQGACVVLDKGAFSSASSFGSLGTKNAASIKVGSNVQATLFANSDLTGRGDTFAANDANLGDNIIGNDLASAVLVQSRATAPAAPAPVYPLSGAAFAPGASISLVWDDGGGGLEYQAVLKLGSTTVRTSDWQEALVYHLGSLDAGTYSWQVKARNNAGESSSSDSWTFTILQSTNVLSRLSPLTAPYEDAMEDSASLWTQTANWTHTQSNNHTSGGSASWAYGGSDWTSYDTGAPNSGDLTSPVISIPNTGEYFLRFWYTYETESNGDRWDQRWVQISADGSHYTNLMQFSSDPSNYWLQSPAISLAEYAGQQVQIRFHFETLDALQNGFKGWSIDDFSITSASAAACNQSTGNTSAATAQAIAYGSEVTGEICPAGDVDYYQFQGAAGDQIGVHTIAQSLGSTLDTTLELLDGDGSSVLAANDDLVLADKTDSTIAYTLAESGTYYLKVKPWDHPSSGAKTSTYTLKLARDDQAPAASFAYPVAAGSVARSTLKLNVNASDNLSGVSHVEFWRHSNDWQNDDWLSVGEDWDGSDGWNYSFDGSTLAEGSGFAFYAKVYDWAGNWVGVGAWNITVGKAVNPVYYPLINKNNY